MSPFDSISVMGGGILSNPINKELDKSKSDSEKLKILKRSFQSIVGIDSCTIR